jgi:hypothetical protein
MKRYSGSKWAISQTSVRLNDKNAKPNLQMLHTRSRVLWASFTNFQKSTLTLRGDYAPVSHFMNNNLYIISISVLSSDIIPTSYVNTFITKTMSKNFSAHRFPDFPNSIVLFKVRTLCPFVLLLRVVLRQMSMEHWWNKAHSGILKSSTFSGSRTCGRPCVRAPNDDLY